MQQIKGLVPHEPMIYYDYLVNHKYSLFTQRGLCKYCVDPYQTAPEKKNSLFCNNDLYGRETKII